MKRLVWLTVLLGLSTSWSGCDDDSSSGGGDGDTADGGVDPLDKLGDDVSNLGNDVDDLQERIDALENPPVGSCSEGELCIPDGVSIASAGFLPIVEQLCAHETSCCDANELNYRFGRSVTDATSCKELFVDLVNNGYTPWFLSASEVAAVIEVAQALNDTGRQVEIVADAVQACADHLEARSCPAITEGSDDERCTPPEADEESPCAIDKLLVGTEPEGSNCTVDNVPECEAGLVCRGIGESNKGLCATPAEVEDRCLSDSQCDELFCNLTTGRCQERSGLGEPCSYVDPTFEDLDPGIDEGSYSAQQDPSRLKVQCERHLWCDPASKTCVSPCSKGSFCFANSQCPEGLACNRTLDEGLRKRTGVGLCSDPIANGMPCRSASECASGLCFFDSAMDEEVGTCTAPRANAQPCNNDDQCTSSNCQYDQADNRNECVPALKEDGAACTTPGSDATCESSVCDANNECATRCYQGDVACPSGEYCSGVYCVVAIANDQACGSHVSCASGFCDFSQQAPVCKPKVAANAACASGYTEQCPNTQYCNGNTGNCTTYAAALAECGNVQCAPGLSCRQAGSVSRCYDLNGNVPAGGPCSSDDHCKTGWCAQNVCADPLPADAACDFNDATKNRCAQGLFCAVVEGTTAGACKPQKTVGQVCNPYYNNNSNPSNVRECLYPYSSCQLRNGQFLCNANSVPPDTIICDGQE
jgi:hypothetical protein